MVAITEKRNGSIISTYDLKSRLELDLTFENEDAEIENRTEVQTDIQQFFDGTCVFISGGTGFMGKVLLEKLLRSCPGLQTIYLLVRPKKGKDIHTRVDEIFEDAVFGKLRKEHPKFRHKVVSVLGDVTLPGLGISPSERKNICEEVSVIFHAAATVRFDEKLKLATAINVKGTYEMLDLARDCLHLRSMVHVSTAYANCPRQEIDEKIYTPPISANKLVHMVEHTPDKILEEITPKLLGKWPNTYAFTKAIAENVIRENTEGLPVCIFRPAIVIATYKEPVRSWIDNVYGPTGVVVGAGTGLLRTLHADKDAVADMVPVDMTVNALIASAYSLTTRRNNSTDIPVFNYVSSCENPITWGEFLEQNKKYGLEVPTVRCIWYYCFSVHKYKLVHLFFSFLLHILPALIIDTALYCIGKKPKMMKIYKKINKFSDVISYFATRTWEFSNGNVQSLWKSLSDVDKKLFFFDIKQLDWEEYNETHILGLRVYLVKDDPSTLPEAKKKWYRFYILHKTIQMISFLICARILWAILNYAYQLVF